MVKYLYLIEKKGHALSISKISQKTSTIMDAFPEFITEKIEEECKSFIKSKAVNTVSTGLYSLIALEISYAYAKNIIFSDDKNFKESLSSYISQNFQISFNEIMDLNENIAIFLSKMKVIPESIDGSLSFIETLVLKSMRCPFFKKSNKDLEFEDFILEKVAKLLTDQTFDIQFLTSLEQEIVESIEKLKKILGNSRPDIDCFYLKSLSPNISKISCNESDFENFWVLDFLSGIPNQREFSQDDFRNFLGEKYNLYEELTIDEALNCLIEEKLIISITKNRYNNTYALTEFGYNISANLYALKQPDNSFSKINADLLSIHPTWTNAILVNRPDLISNEIFDRKFSIHPDALASIANFLTYTQPDTLANFSEFLKISFQESSNAFMRKNCIEVLAEIETVENKREYLSSILKDETSQMVVNSSIKHLIDVSAY